MRHFLMVLFLAASLTGCASTHSAIKENTSFAKYKKVYLLNFEEDPRKVLPIVQVRLAAMGFEVILTEEDEPIGGMQGTGFVVSPDGYVLTSAHVLNDKKEATLWLDGKRYEADVVFTDHKDEPKKDKKSNENKNIDQQISETLNSKDNKSIFEDLEERDIALLKIRTTEANFVPLNFAKDPEFKMGQDVFTIGFPLSDILGNKPRLNKGLISSTVGMKDNPNFVQMSVETQPGNSGGPLLDDKGRVVGIVQMTLNPMSVLKQTGNNLPQNVNFAVKSSLIREFLTAAGDKAKFVLKENEVMPFDVVQSSIAQVYSGIVPEGFREEPKLACAVYYTYFWDMWYRFTRFEVIFRDPDTQETLLQAGQYGDNPFSTEGKTIDKVFKDIKTKMGR